MNKNRGASLLRRPRHRVRQCQKNARFLETTRGWRSQCRVRVIMPQTVNVGDARARLSHLIACAEAGEDVIIARDGVPAARIVPASGFAA